MSLLFMWCKCQLSAMWPEHSWYIVPAWDFGKYPIVHIKCLEGADGSMHDRWVKCFDLVH